MTKEEIHDKLRSGSCTIPVSDFVSVYGDDRKIKAKGQEMCRGKVLADRYGLNCQRTSTEYIFNSR